MESSQVHEISSDQVVNAKFLQIQDSELLFLDANQTSLFLVPLGDILGVDRDSDQQYTIHLFQKQRSAKGCCCKSVEEKRVLRQHTV